MKVIKANGAAQDFNDEKLLLSLRVALVTDDLAKATLEYVKSKLKGSVTTQDIYHTVEEYLNQNGETLGALNYDLKRAVMRLGPTGYPFERFVARVLNNYECTTEVGVVVAGFCVDHEIDISAIQDNTHYLIECKFHTSPGTKTDIQVALYTQARFEDVKSALDRQPDHARQFHQAWLITNTKPTKDAINYAHCRSMRLTGWSYPEKGNLRQLIIDSGLQPITSLSLLNDRQLRILLDREIVTLSDLQQALQSNKLTDIIEPDLSEKLKKINADLYRH